MEGKSFVNMLIAAGLLLAAAAHSNPAFPQADSEDRVDVDSMELYSCDVFLAESQKLDCLKRRNEELEYLRKYYEDEPGDFIQTIKTEESELAEEPTTREVENKAVFDHLYEQIYYYRSGVFNYERKMN